MKLPGTRKTLLSGIAITAVMAASAAMAGAPSAPAANGPQADFPVVVGAPYQIDGVTFVPSDSMNFDSVGYAAVGQEGGSTISAAHHTLPLPSYAEVTDLKTGRTILVRVERRGPGDSNHAIELSPGAAAQLGITAGSNAGVRVRRVNPPEQERALLRSGNPAPERMATPKPLLDVLQRKLDPALAQRTLDAEDRDPVPAKPATQLSAKPTPAPTLVSKPVVQTAKPEKPAKSPKLKPEAIAKADAPAAPPMGYVPSVPAPAAQPAEKPQRSRHQSLPKASVAAPDPAKAPSGDAAKPALATKPAEAPKPAEDKPAHAGSFVIQAGAYSDQKRAQAVADKIGGTVSAAGKLWRVRVGPFSAHASAEAALAKVKSAGYSDARIQRGE
ncbi:septal ring lytic transglycosylase RlpA family protein [Novosphingobium terrae]|uniref:septal ring lytic transglycosylase RlpA family protein n=1 Tax=Novosphingobium terrae TaxID=2726189 RepID=UPI001F129C06|nr:SPOR domain-containing protein [Novosphingobium terrae]